MPHPTDTNSPPVAKPATAVAELDDDESAHSPFASIGPNTTIGRLLTLLHTQGMIAMRTRPGEWRIHCPNHSPAVPSVRIEQRPREVVWIYPPADFPAASCDCRPQRIISIWGCADPRVLPAGEQYQRPERVAKSAAATSRDSAAELTPQGRADLEQITVGLEALGLTVTEVEYDDWTSWVSACPLCAADGVPGGLFMHARDEPRAGRIVVRCHNSENAHQDDRPNHRMRQIGEAIDPRLWFVREIAAAAADLARTLEALKARGLRYRPGLSGWSDSNHEGPCPICVASYPDPKKAPEASLYVSDNADADNDSFGTMRMECETNKHDSDVILAALDIVTRAQVRETHSALDWGEAPTEGSNWLDEPLIECGQFVSIYGPPGIGKSLLAQERAAVLSRAGRCVLYLDAENPMNEVKARLQAMGFTDADLAHLTYLSFPGLPPLNTEAGAAQLAAIVNCINPELIVLDTWSKFISGAEADPALHTAAYNQSIVPLRRAGRAVLAIDHGGKDLARGPRGGSSKVDNVDTLWLLTIKAGGRVRLERRKSRTGRGVDLVELVRQTGPLRHDRLDLAPADTLGPEIRGCVAKLDELEVPTGWGRPRAAEVLRLNAFPVRNETLSEAMKVRRERGTTLAADLSPDLGDSGDRSADSMAGTARGQAGE